MSKAEEFDAKFFNVTAVGGALIESVAASAGKLLLKEVPNNTYSGNVYHPDFVGPVQWEYFYRGDAMPRTNFLSSMSQRDGVAAADNFLDNLSGGARSEILAEHGVSSATSPYISTSRNPAVAKYFARGPGQAQDGYLTTFRIEAREAKLLQDQGQIVPNFENPMSFFEPNPKLAYRRFRNSIDPRYIYQQIPVNR